MHTCTVIVVSVMKDESPLVGLSEDYGRNMKKFDPGLLVVDQGLMK